MRYTFDLSRWIVGVHIEHEVWDGDWWNITVYFLCFMWVIQTKDRDIGRDQSYDERCDDDDESC